MIGQWFRYRYQSKNKKASQEKVTDIFSELHKMCSPHPTRRRKVEVYTDMHRADIDKAFAAYWDDLIATKPDLPQTPGAHLTEYNAFRIDRLKAESKKVQDEVAEEVEVIYRAETAEWKDRKKWSGNPEDYARYVVICYLLFAYLILLSAQENILPILKAFSDMIGKTIGSMVLMATCFPNPKDGIPQVDM